MKTKQNSNKVLLVELPNDQTTHIKTKEKNIINTVAQNKKNSLLIGAHMSISGGFYKALERGASIGCSAIQIFTHSNRQWNVKDITQDQIDLFIKAKIKTGINEIVVHSSYLVNLGSNNMETRKKSIETIKKELTHCHDLGIKYLIIHTGSGYKDNSQKCLDQIASNLDKVFDETENTNTMILLENMAGQGSCVGSNFEQLGYILKNIKNEKRVGICFDTCHAWAAGYNFSDSNSYKLMWKNFNKTIGFEKLKAIHINDSKTKFNSHVDRHAKIGQGTIGIEAFQLLINDPKLKNVIKILETPSDDYKEYEKEIENLTNMYKKT